jgi:1,3-beta-glucanosyltransferase GAS5
MKGGAGKGPGLEGPGSQDSGSDSSGTAAPGSGSATGKSDARPIGPFDGTPFLVTAVALIFSIFGAAIF